MATTLATESWGNTSNRAWPSQWTTGATGTGGSATVANNQGVLNTGSDQYAITYADLSGATASANQDLLVTIAAMPASAGVTISLDADANGQYGYNLNLYTYGNTTGGFDIQRNEAGNSTPITSSFQSIPLTAASYYVRFQVIGGVIKFKYWATTDTEPAAWTFTGTDATPLPAGKVTLYTQYIGGGAANSVVIFDNFTLTDGAPAYHTETWTGTNGAAWPATWTTGTNFGTNTAATIQGNQGQLNFGDTKYGSVYGLYAGTEATTDTDLTVTIPNLPTFGNALISIRATADGNEQADFGYTLVLYCFGNGIGAYQLIRSDGSGTSSALINYTGVSLPNTSYTVRIQSVDATVQFKLWATSGTEPTSWTASATDSAPVPAGRVRLGMQYTDGATASSTMTFDTLSVLGYAPTDITPLPDPILPLVYVGHNAISAVKMGTQDVSAIYIGLNKVYPFSSTAPIPLSPTMPVGNVVSNGITWVPSYSNDFTTPAALGQVRSIYNQMGYYDGFNDTSNLGYYAPDKVLSVHDSYLDVNMHTENGQPLVSTVMPDNYAPHTSVRYSVRFKTTATGPGYKFVGIMWPSSNTWNEGEIDWPEADLTHTARPADAIPGSYNTTNPNSMTFSPNRDYNAATDTSDWHIATTEWTPTYIKYYWDNALVYTESVTANIPTVPMRVTLQSETFINEGAVPAASVGHVLIDWVVIYDQQV